MPDAGQYDWMIDQAATQYGLDPGLLKSQLNAESSMDPNAVNPRTGAAGIAQFMPATAAEMNVDPMDPAQAIPAAAAYMRKNLDANNGDYPSALAAYNWGPGNLKRHGLENAPPETKAYIDKVMGGAQNNVVNADQHFQPTGITIPVSDPSPQASAQPGTVDADQHFQPTGITIPVAPPQTTPTPVTVTPSEIHQQAPPQAVPITPSRQVPPAQQQPDGPAWYSLSDVGSSLQQGFSDALREGKQTLGTGGPFQDQPAPAPQPQRSLAGDFVYNLAHSSPVLGGALAGGAVGAAVPGAGETGISEITGAGLGAATVSIVQALNPAYQQARANGMSHDDAMAYAIKVAGTEGAISGVSTALLGLAPVKTIVGRMLFGAATQPIVGATERTAVPLATGQPLPSGKEYLKGAAQDVVGGLAVGAASEAFHGAVKAATGRAQSAEELAARYAARPQQRDQVRPGDYQSTNRPLPPGSDGRFPTDNRGFVASTQGGPLKFDNHAEAARWILDVGHKQSPDQIFEIENHPVGGLTIRERGRVETPPPGQPGQPGQTEAPPAAAPEAAPPEPPPAEPPKPTGPDLVRTPAPVEEPAPTPAPQGEPNVPAPAPEGPSPRPPEVTPTGPTDTGAVPPVGAPAGGVPHEGGGVAAAAAPTGDVSGPAPGLIRAYHGTTADIKGAFTSGEGIGPHFGTVDQAHAFATGEGANIHPVDLAIKNPLRLPDGQWENPPGLALKLKDAGVINEKQLEQINVLDKQGKVDPSSFPAAFDKLRNWIAAKGYDGIVYKNVHEGTGIGKPPADSYIPLRADQVRTPGGAKPPEGYEPPTPAGEALQRDFPKVPPKPEPIGTAEKPIGTELKTGAVPAVPGTAKETQQPVGGGTPGTAEQPQPAWTPMSERGGMPVETPISPEHGTATPEVTPTEAPGEKPNVTVAAREQDQPRLDETNRMLNTLKTKTIKSPEDRERIDKLQENRDKLLKKAPGSRRKPIDLGRPKPEGAPKGHLDYAFQDGTPVWKHVFEEAGHPVAQAVNMRIEHQIKILADHAKTKFGFDNVTVDPRADTYDTRNALLDFHRAAQDMVSALGMPIDMVGLKIPGQNKPGINLHIAGPQGRVLGSYTPATRTILIAGRANSFGHEWIHALDHDMVDTMFTPGNARHFAMLSGRNAWLDPNSPMAERIGNVLNTMFYDKGDLAAKVMKYQLAASEVDAHGNPTPAAKQAQTLLDQMKVGANLTNMKPTAYHKLAERMGDITYWPNPMEMLARASEAYIARKMEQSGYDPRGVVMPNDGYLLQNDNFVRMAFPQQGDRINIFAALDHMFDGYRSSVLGGSPAATQSRQDGISDPLGWTKLTKDPRKSGIMGEFRDTAERIRNLRRTLKQGVLFDSSRPEALPGNKLSDRIIKDFNAKVDSAMAILEATHHHAPDGTPAKLALKELMDRFGYVAGSGEYTGFQGLESRSRQLHKEVMNEFGRALTWHGLDESKMDGQQKAMLRHVMVTGENTFPTDPLDPNSPRVPIPNNIVNAGEPLRRISDYLFNLMRKAGIEIGYAKNGHFPRLYDQVAAANDPRGFKLAAETLHKFMFDQDVGQPGDDPQKLLDYWDDLGAVPQPTLGAGPPKSAQERAPMQTQGDMERLRKLLRDLAKKPDPAKEAEAQQLAQDNHDAVRELTAETNAMDWFNRLTRGYGHDFPSHGPGGKFLNKRVLPPEADIMMRGFLHNDPFMALTRYYEAAARRISYSERFGGKGEKYNYLLDQLSQGGLSPEDQAIVTDVAKFVTGQSNNGSSAPMAQAANVISSAVSLGVMPRVTWSMFAEPYITGLAGGDARAGFHALAGIFGNLAGTKDAARRAELLDYFGVTTNALYDNINQARMGPNYNDSPMLDKFMSKFYRVNFVPQLTDWNRRAAMAGVDWLMRKWSKDILNPQQHAGAEDNRAEAHRMFNELGVHPDLHTDVATWLLSHGGKPILDEIQRSPYGKLYGRMVYEMIDRSILDPKNIDLPTATGNKWSGLPFQYNKYNYAFKRYVIDPTFKRLGWANEQAYQRGKGAGWGETASRWRGRANFMKHMSYMGMSVLGYIAATGIASTARQYFLAQDEWQQHEEDGTLDDWLLGLAVERAALGGPISPITEMASNLKFHQDLASLYNGAGVTWAVQNGYNTGKAAWDLAWGNQPKTNTTYFEGVRSVYNLLGSFAMAYMAIRLGEFGNIGKLVGSALDQWGTAPQTADRLATAAVGEKGTSLEEDGGLPKLPLPDLPKIKLPPIGGPQPAGADEQGSNSLVGQIPWGLVDDFVLPAWTAAQPVLSRIPGPLKILGVGALGAYELSRAVDITQPYRDAAPPKKKETETAQ